MMMMMMMVNPKLMDTEFGLIKLEISLYGAKRVSISFKSVVNGRTGGQNGRLPCNHVVVGFIRVFF